MSLNFANKLFNNMTALFLLVIAHFFLATNARANTFNVTITISSSDSVRVRVEGVTATETKAWSFPGERLSVGGRKERVSNFILTDAAGASVSVRKLAPGEFEAERPATRFSYDLALDPPFNTSEAAHLSWLTGERGILILSDVLPLLPSRGWLTLKLPSNWQALSVETKDKQGEFEISNTDRALFVIGRDLRTRNIRIDSMEVSYVVAGAWAFPDQELIESSKESLDDYRKLMGGTPGRHLMVVLLPFPGQVAGAVWSAETRGRTVLLLSGRLPSKYAALAQLNGALTHELLHLWVPNSLALQGEYAWFYEGFTLYQALRTGMRQGRLTFQDYLTALGRAFDGYKSSKGTRELSLIEASERRWTSNPAFIYHKGMLVAFLYDLRLMQQTEGKRSLDDVYRELYQSYGRTENKTEATSAIIAALQGKPGMNGFADKYIRNPLPLDLSNEIGFFGLRIAAGGVRTHIVVAESINRQQRDLLRRLGYNDKGDASGPRLRPDIGSQTLQRR